MAESVCEVARNRNKKIRLMSENGEFLSVNREKQVSDDGLNLKSIFYLNNLENNCFTKYSVNNDGVNRSSGFCPHVDGFPPEYKGICPNNDENCRKKRCSDRYDSSESSDSGIAVSSSASSGTSDITDPGSPFSTSSDDSSSSPAKCKEEKRCKSEEKSPGWSEPSGRCGSEEKTWTTESWESKQQQKEQQQQQEQEKQKQKNDKTDKNFSTPETDFKMAPNVPSASSPCGIWTSITENNTANETAHFNNNNNKYNKSEAIINNNNNNNHNNNNNNNNNNSNKRLKIEDADALTVNGFMSVANGPSLERDGGAERKVGSVADDAESESKPRRTGSDKGNKETGEICKIAKAGAKASDKSAGSAGKAKQERSRHQGKITEYFKSQVKSLAGVKRDYNYVKKDGAQGKRSDGVKKSDEAKKSKMEAATGTGTGAMEKELPLFVKPSPKLQQTVMPLANKILLPKLQKAPDFLSKKPPETKTLFNKILQNHKNRKLAEMKSKAAAAAVAASAAPSQAAQATQIATPGKESDAAPCQKPYEISTRNATITELPKNVDELSSKLDDKVQNNELDSNLLKIDSKQKDIVNCELVISKGGNGGDCDSIKSPILSAPKTIRFPANCHNNNVLDKHISSSSRSPSVVCRWDACSVECGSATGLLEHLQSAHVLTQVSGEKFVCLWVGCKVFDQKSCSRSWLERHVLSHAGNKPFRCIVDGCGQGFSSQIILERHVNSHFQADVKKALDNPLAHKLFRRNGKKIRYRRQPWSARMFDFFDSGIMEALEYRLVRLTKIRTGGDVTDTSGKTLALTSQVVARRMTANGRQQFLLRWYPLNIVEDEWVYEKDIVPKKIVSIPSLSPSVSSSLQETLELVVRPSGSCRRKNKSNYRTSEIRAPIEEPSGKAEEGEEEEPEAERPESPVAGSPEPIQEEGNDLKTELSNESHLPPPPKVPDKAKPKTKVKKRRAACGTNQARKGATPPSAGIPAGDPTTKDETATTGRIVSLKPKEEESVMSGAAAAAALPEEIPLVPVCPPAEELIPVQTGGIIVDSTKLIAPVKTDMILGSPVKLVTSQYIEQPFVQTVMPVQMPVAYQIPIVKLSPPSGMFLPQIPNYIIPPSPAVFPTSPVSTFRNGFHLSATGTIQIQTSSTTLQHTGSNFMQSTNASGFQIVQSPVTLPQSILTAFQNSGIGNLSLKSPTLRLLNCQPLILNKPIANVSMTVTNVTTTRAEQQQQQQQQHQHQGALTVPAAATAPPQPVPTVATAAPIGPPHDGIKPGRKVTGPNKKMVKQKLTILPKPNVTKTSVPIEGGKSKKQCLQPCGPTTRAAT